MIVPPIITQCSSSSLIKEVVDRQDSAVSGIHNQPHASKLPDLPFEVWFQIFSRLDAISLLVASRVSRHWTKISSDHTLWRNLCLAHQICLDDDESQAIFAEALAMSIMPGSLSPSTSGWKKLFIRHHKNEQRNRVLGKLFWASHEVNALQRFLNLAPVVNRPRMLTYGGEAVPCPQCEREKELLAQMEIMMPSSSESSVSTTLDLTSPSRTLYAHNGIFLDRLGPISLNSTKASMILHTLSDQCSLGASIPNFVPRNMIIRSTSPYLSHLLHESLIGSTIGMMDSPGASASSGTALLAGSISDMSGDV